MKVDILTACGMMNQNERRQRAMLFGGNQISLTPVYQTCEAADTLLCFMGDDVLLEGSPPMFALPAASVLSVIALPTEPFYLFTLEGRRVYALDATLPTLPPLTRVPVHFFRQMPSHVNAYTLITAWHLVVWRRRNRYCGNCAAPLVPSQTECALTCPRCEQTVYPSISPAISVAVIDGDRILLARNKRSAFTHFSLIAGYVEAGETLEEAVKREVREEVGLSVQNLRYIGSQAWGFTQSEMIGFYAELDGSDKIILQTDELSEARWFKRVELEPKPDPMSLSFDMIERFRKGKL